MPQLGKYILRNWPPVPPSTDIYLKSKVVARLKNERVRIWQLV